MRVRLPHSVLSSLLARVAQNSKHPVKSFVQQNPLIPHRQRFLEQRARAPESPLILGARHDVLAGSALGQGQRPADEPESEPESEPKLTPLSYSAWRNFCKDGGLVRGINRYLDAHPLPPNPSHSDLVERQFNYTGFFVAFLNRSSDTGFDGIMPVIERSLSEGIPLHSIAFTNILQSSLLVGNDHYRAEVVRRVMPLLPEQLDVVLLAAVLRVAIVVMRPKPIVVQQVISDCLKLDGMDDMDQWPWILWEVVLGAHRALGDLPGALRLLESLKETVHREIAFRVRQNPEMDPQDVLDEGERDDVTRAFEVVMTLWRENLRRPKDAPGDEMEEDFQMELEIEPEMRSRPENSDGKIPGQLAQDLLGIVGEDVGVRFLASWLKAERAGNNWEAVEMLCEAMSKRMEEELEENLVRRSSKLRSQMTPGERRRVREIVPASVGYWTCFFSLYRTPLAVNLPPLRKSVARLISQRFIRPDARTRLPVTAPHITSHVVLTILTAIFRPLDVANAAMSSAAAEKIDLPLALLVMSLVDNRRAPAPLTFMTSARNIGIDLRLADVLLSGIYRTATYGLPPRMHEEVGMFLPPGVGSDHSARGSREMGQSRLNPAEWERVMQAVHRARIEGPEGKKLMKAETEAGMRGGARSGFARGKFSRRALGLKPIGLPLSADQIPSAVQSSSTIHLNNARLTDAEIEEAEKAFLKQRRKDVLTLSCLMKAQRLLLEKAVVAFTRHHRQKTAWRRAAAGELVGEKLSDKFEDVLEHTLGKVKAQVLPQPTPKERETQETWEEALAEAMEGDTREVKVDEVEVDDADLDEAEVDEAGVDEAGVDEAGVDEAGVDEAGVDEAGVDEAGMGDADRGESENEEESEKENLAAEEGKVPQAAVVGARA
ncbi:hypothetical protein IAT38_006398 [Cryptococcus sp. DSM 104549]